MIVYYGVLPTRKLESCASFESPDVIFENEQKGLKSSEFIYRANQTSDQIRLEVDNRCDAYYW